MTEELQKKVEKAVRLIQAAGADGSVVEVNMSRVLCEALARKLMDKAA